MSLKNFVCRLSSKGLIADKKCQGSEEFLEERLKGIEKRWSELIEACHLKTKKLMEANEQQKFQYSMQDLEFWLGEVCKVISSHAKESRPFHIKK